MSKPDCAKCGHAEASHGKRTGRCFDAHLPSSGVVLPCDCPGYEPKDGPA